MERKKKLILHIRVDVSGANNKEWGLDKNYTHSSEVRNEKKNFVWSKWKTGQGLEKKITERQCLLKAKIIGICREPWSLTFWGDPLHKEEKKVKVSFIYPPYQLTPSFRNIFLGLKSRLVLGSLLYFIVKIVL